VILYQDGGMRTRARLLTTHARSVESVLALPGRSLVVTAGAEGHLRFFSLPDLRSQAALKTPGERLTSLHVSPDGAFFATGANDSTLALWDLRVQDIPALFNTPAASIRPSQMALINTLAGYGQALPAPVLSALCYLQTLLAHRFRFDIEVSETASIQVGEFDVFLD
jgi:WD40 repeat protein